MIRNILKELAKNGVESGMGEIIDESQYRNEAVAPAE